MNEDIRSVEMNEEERAAFLGTGGTGVVSAPAGADESPYSRPVSYGYDATEGEFYFRLAFDPESEKTGVVGDRRPVTFVTYDQTEDGWKSVVVTGRLKEVTEAAIDSDVVQAIRRIHIPLVDLYERPPRELDFRFFQLATESVSGRKEAHSER